ncbi:hypothetical protein NHX12_002887 [Muraenolepis orangiensis]|uniref:Peptidase M12B propeptide domain-containing protein n=1 Tax=Muraenolepis orangiensis TaxID=630683 RepID=A0A9Q0E0A8_9TELE|nr:hypothetical protein NHX12_002887 [Muraenolepis orangiensis]
MQFAIWLLGLVCHLSALVRNSLEYRLHPKQESFIKQLSSYEIITPLRVDHAGDALPYRLHYRRRRRTHHYYRVDAFGERFHLNLTADSGFIAPAYTVQHRGAEQQHTGGDTGGDPGGDTGGDPGGDTGGDPGGDTGGDPGGHRSDDMRHCFFRGHVNAKTHFPAVFSLCAGLIGTFTTHSGDYFLEPLMAAEGEEHTKEEHNKPHLGPLFRVLSGNPQPLVPDMSSTMTQGSG